MKWREMIITAFACVFLIMASAFGFSFVYQILFHPDVIIENGSEGSAEWQLEQAVYERGILDPFSSVEEETLLQIDGEYLLSDLYHINTKLYSDVFHLAGLDWADIENADITTYEFRSDTVEYRNYGLRLLFDIVLGGENSNNSVMIVADKEEIPLLFMCKGSNGSESFISYSVEYADLPSKLFDYLAEIDEIFESYSTYHLCINAISDELPIGEDRPPGSLEEYCRYGEWQVYSDSSVAAYVCIIGDKNFIAYYDMVSDEFCGYNIAFNEF